MPQGPATINLPFNPFFLMAIPATTPSAVLIYSTSVIAIMDSKRKYGIEGKTRREEEDQPVLREE
jgi:hypothetical protein